MNNLIPIIKNYKSEMSRNKISRRNKARHSLRIKLFIQQQGRCILCNKLMNFNYNNEGKLEATFEHLIPKKLGGKFSCENIALSHRKCNLDKGNKIYIKETPNLHLEEENKLTRLLAYKINLELWLFIGELKDINKITKNVLLDKIKEPIRIV